MNRLTERQKKIMLLAARDYGGNMDAAAKADRLFGMALKHCLAPLRSQHYCVDEGGIPVLTTEGYAAVGLAAAPVPAEPEAGATPRTRAMRTGTKLDMVVRLLRSPGGTTIDEIARATGWKSHTIRAVISRTVQKELRIEVNVWSRPGEPRHYQAKN